MTSTAHATIITCRRCHTQLTLNQAKRLEHADPEAGKACDQALETRFQDRYGPDE